MIQEPIHRSGDAPPTRCMALTCGHLRPQLQQQPCTDHDRHSILQGDIFKERLDTHIGVPEFSSDARRGGGAVAAASRRERGQEGGK